MFRNASLGSVIAGLVLIVAVIALLWGLPSEKFTLGMIAALAFSRIVP